MASKSWGFAFSGGRLLGMLFLLLTCLCLSVSASAQLQALSDGSLAEQSGQGLLDMVTINPGQAGAASAPAIDNGLTFYRMAINGTLNMNANINQLNLGCGGVNDALVPGVCDISFDYVRFLGNNGNNGPGAPGSDFTLQRPYITLAVNNAGSNNRDLVGVQIGSQSATGYFGVGQVLNNGQVNPYNGKTCGGSNDPNCQIGINAFSGNIGLTMNGQVSGTTWLLPLPYTSKINNVSTVQSGTRMQQAYVMLSSTPTTIAGLLTINASIALTEPMKYIHGMSFNGIPNFALSMQRQQVSWPNYDYTSATDGYYATPANTGWWMNMPSNVTINGINGTYNLSASQTAGALFVTIPLSNVSMGQTPVRNCMGSVTFC